MRIMMMHKTAEHWEAGALPGPELIAGMGKLIEEMKQAGVFLAGEGLRPSSLGVRLKFDGGKRTLTPGPFAGSNELMAGFALIRVKSMEEAIEWASRFASAVGDVEIDIRPVTEPWDLGLCPRPAGETTTRFMMAHKADENSEAGVPPTSELMAEMKTLTDDMVRAGVFLSAEGLQPSSMGVRLNFSAGRRTATDGPFTESKELIAGFVMLQVSSLQEAIEYASRFASVVGDVEVDIRQLYEAPEIG
ncbi:MAG TPA: YciI family protein [Isosphaeraceae bacterium]|jgi:hypothetical protein|nr:YciI family protein [Isosphaeraceae bacterium]